MFSKAILGHHQPLGHCRKTDEMKKDYSNLLRAANQRLIQILRIMRITTILIIMTMMQASATTFAQKITLSEKNTPLGKVFIKISRQTGYDFWVNGDMLSRAKPVSIIAKDAELVDVLREIFNDQPLGYTLSENLVTVTFKRQSFSGRIERNISKEIEVRGRVLDQNGNPLSQASVKVEGIAKAYLTDRNGTFLIPRVRENAIITITYVGFKPLEVKAVADLGELRLTIKENNLDEVNVVAYGTTTRREATGSLSTVKAKDFAGNPSSSIANLLQGRVAGLDVTNISGSPGSGGIALTIRGYNSLDVEQGRRFSNPLWVVDGVPLNSFTSPVTGTNLLADLNPEMIESIQVLKDASAASLYGSRAANGVVIVTTKKGKKDQPANFSVNLSKSYNILPRLPTVTTGNAERDLRLAALRNNPRAYLDPLTQRYRYPSNYLDVYRNPTTALRDYFERGVPSESDGNFLQDSLNTFYNNSTNFFPAYYETGQVTNANIQAYGGAKNMNYGIGLGYFGESGVLKGSGYERIDLNSTLNVSPKDKFHIDLSFNASLTNRKRGEKTNSIGASPIIETVPGDPFKLSSLYPGEGSSVWNNVLERISKIKEDNRSVRLRSNFRLSYDILPSLAVSTSLAADYAVHRRNSFTPSYLNENGYSRSIGETGVNLLALNENLLTYKKLIDNSHAISLIAGVSYQYDQEEYNGASADNSPSDEIYYARPGFPLFAQRTVTGLLGQSFTETAVFQAYQSDMQEKALFSYFSRFEYNYKQRYLLSASFRRDGSSVFGTNNQWGTFPSLALGWSFSEEPFIKKRMPWLNFGKFRASWGRSGMHFSQNYLALGIMKAGALPHENKGVLVPQIGDGLYNEDLSWEETDQLDFGIDIDLFNNRLGITSDYYYRYTDKMLMAVRLPGNYNGYQAQWRNAAAVSNQGIELLVNYELFRKPNLAWKITLNGARNWNRFEKSNNGRDVTSDQVLTNSQWVIGKPLSGIYAFRSRGFIGSQDEVPIYYNTGGVSSYYGAAPINYFKPGDYGLVDVNGDGVLTTAGDAVYVGSALPVFSGGLGSELRHRNLELNLLFSYQLGRHIVNALPMESLRTNDQNLEHPLLMDIRRARFWRKPGDDAQYVPTQFDSGSGLYSPMIDRFVEKVNWLKLKSVTLRYHLPASMVKRLKMEGIQIFASSENVFTLTNYSGLDPETVNISSGIDPGTNYPLARRFTCGLTLKF